MMIRPTENTIGNSGDNYGGWDRHGRTREMRWTRGGSLIDRSVRTFDRLGQCLTQTDMDGVIMPGYTGLKP